MECEGNRRKEVLNKDNTAVLNVVQRVQQEMRVSKEKQNSMPAPGAVLQTSSLLLRLCNWGKMLGITPFQV